MAIFSAADSMDRWRLVVVTFVGVQVQGMVHVWYLVSASCIISHQIIIFCSFQF